MIAGFTAKINKVTRTSNIIYDSHYGLMVKKCLHFPENQPLIKKLKKMT